MFQTDMAELRYPRFNQIYASREEAIKKLDNLSRSYAEPVTIRYYDENNKICVILAMYKSDSVGDYVINFDESFIDSDDGSSSVEDLENNIGDGLTTEVDESGNKILDVNTDDSTIIKTDSGLSVGTVYGGSF